MRRGHSPQPESFANYYLRAVAFAEGCNCAELVVRRTMPQLGPAGRPDERSVWQTLVARVAAWRRKKRAR